MPENSPLSRAIIRSAVRISIVSLAVAIVIAAVYFTVTSVPALSAENLRRGFIGTYRRRLLAPRPGAIVEFAKELLVMGLVALIGRKILRLHL